MRDKGEDEGFYDERQINYAKAKAYIEVTVEKLQKQVDHWRAIAAITSISACIAVVIAGIVFLSKEVTPILVKYNETTGVVSVSEVNAQEITSLTAIDALNKHWINKFIVCAETYDKKDQLRLYECVKHLTSKKVFAQYSLRFERGEKDNWFDRYKEATTPIKVISINRIPRDIHSKEGSSDRWIVKFTKEIKKTERQKGELLPYSAVLEASFEQIARNESDIRINPLNFTVLSFRVDRETIQTN
jgi:type IV secretory pathway component VirB8